MSHRIIVNTSNPLFSSVTKNGKGAEFGLGESISLDDIEGEEELQREIKSEEIVFTSDELKDKRRKFQVALNNLTAPEFFVDELVNGEKVKTILDRYITDLKSGNFSAVPNVFRQIAGLGLIAQGGLVAYAAVYSAITLLGTGVGVAGVSTLAGGVLANIIQGSIFGGPVGFIVAAAIFVGAILFGPSEQEKENKAMRWTFNKADFPTIPNGAFRGGSQRSPARLYGIYGSEKRDQIGLFVRDLVTDVLFSKNGVLLDGHPNRTVSGVEAYNKKQELIPFVKVTPTDNNQTYVNAVLYIASYISLIDAILSLNDESLSRSLDVESVELQTTLYISLATAKVPLYDTMISESRNVIQNKVLSFLDDRKEYKTLLNFGNDTQYVAESWRFKPDSTGSIQVKLLTPLSSQFQIYDRPIISRELGKSVIDAPLFRFSDLVDFTPKLRPYNQAVADKYKSDKKVLNNITLSVLSMSIGAEGTPVTSQAQPVNYNDPVFQRLYTDDYNSSLLNLDFGNYSNFISYGSAKNRLAAFTEKLKRIEILSSSTIGSTQADKKIAVERQEIIRSFDPYEQYLYFASGASFQYSASVYYTDSLIEYNSTGSWPRSGSTLLSTTNPIAVNWYASQSAIAERYDENNPNCLSKHLPLYIQEDSNSQEFVKFITMFGHVIDNLTLYVDQMSNIYSTNPDPYKELTIDQVYDVAKSFGLELPNVYSITDLQKYVESIYGKVDESSRGLVAETWKRFLHSMVYLYKSKGSKKALDAIINLYGINPQALQIKESSYPTIDTFIKRDELSYGLKFSSQSNNYLNIPLVSSSFTTNTVSVRFIPSRKVSSSLLTGDLNKWVVDIVPHPSASTTNVVKNQGRIEIFSGSSRTRVASSSYFELFGEDYTTLFLYRSPAVFRLIQTDGDQILYEYSASSNVSSTVWNATSKVYVGGSGSIKSSTHFDGIVDEVRFWNENITYDNSIKQAYDPGGTYGSSYSSSVEGLYTALKFSQPTASVTQSVENETPYGSPNPIYIPAVGFNTSSFTRISRTIKQFVPIVGATVYSNKKTTVAPPPVFKKNFLDSNNVPILTRLKSIVTKEEKKYTGGLNIVSLGVSPIDYINSNIIRTIGQENINNAIGNPRDLKDNKYDKLNTLFNFYKKHYNTKVDVNAYIDFYKNLPQAPVEIADTMVPAKAKLYRGIIIESPILSRIKLGTIKDIKIGGKNTKSFDNILSSTGTSETVNDMGTYTLDSDIPVTDDMNILSDTLDLNARLAPSSSLVNSTNQYYEQEVPTLVEDTVVGFWNYYDSGSSAIGTQLMTYAASHSGYPRNPTDNELLNDKVNPFYDIRPRTDFEDYGAITYFNNPAGIYSFSVYTVRKQNYLAVFETPETGSVSELYSKITLLLPEAKLSGQFVPQRSTSTISSTLYPASTTTEGTVSIANLFSLLAVSGTTGLRVRLYRTAENRTNDPIDRPLTTPPFGNNNGVLFDGTLDGIAEVNPFLLVQTEGYTIYYRITNTTGSSITSSIVFSYFAYDPLVVVPRGYLPRHYRFTALRSYSEIRRNFLGCKATVADGIADPLGRPPGGIPPGETEDIFTRPFYSIPTDYRTAEVVGEVGATAVTEAVTGFKNSLGRLRT
jgi:hypothetical protein